MCMPYIDSVNLHLSPFYFRFIIIFIDNIKTMKRFI